MNFDTFLRGNHTLAVLRILAGLFAGQTQEEVLRRHTNVKGSMLMVVLPFEEYHSVESARLENCPSAFAYEDPDTGKVKTVPVCMWRMYRNEILRKIAARYQGVPVTS